MDNTALVGMARLWGDYEHRVLVGEEISVEVMKGHDDMDLARLLEEWNFEFQHQFEQDKNEYLTLEELFFKKLKELCREHFRQIRLDKAWEKDRAERDPRAYPKAILVERDYKGEYERFALTQEEFREKFPEVPVPRVHLGAVHKANTFTIQPLVHLWYKPCTVGDNIWEFFFGDMAHGIPERDIEDDNLATIRLDLFGELKMYISPYTYVTANEHTGASEEELVKEWNSAMGTV